MMAVCWPLSVSDFLKWAFVWQEQLLGSNTSCKGTIPDITSSPLSVFPPHNLRSWQVYCGTDTVYKILAGLQDNSYLQGTNILVEKTPKNISQNQICCNRAIYKVLCVGVWKRNFSTSTLILNGYCQGRETLILISLVQFTEAKPSSKEDPALYLAQGRNFRGGKICLCYSVGSYLVGRETEGGEHFGSFEHSDVHSLLFLAPWRRSQSRNWNSENFWDHTMISVGGIRFRVGLISLYEFEQTPGDDGQGSLVCCSPWGCEEVDMT